MERLTKRIDEDTEPYISCEVCKKKPMSECWSQENCTQTAVDRPSSIEDILGDDYDLERLRVLVEADRDGRCKVLPVKEGTPVFYVLNDPFVVEHPVIYEAPFDIRDYYDNDITVCFSLEDAEAVLKGERDG